MPVVSAVLETIGVPVTGCPPILMSKAVYFSLLNAGKTILIESKQTDTHTENITSSANAGGNKFINRWTTSDQNSRDLQDWGETQ